MNGKRQTSKVKWKSLHVLLHDMIKILTKRISLHDSFGNSGRNLEQFRTIYYELFKAPSKRRTFHAPNLIPIWVDPNN